jgi:pilus assembly protein CpaB
MNPRQRRGVVLTALSVVGAVGVFTAVSGYTAAVARQLGPTRPVLVLARDLPSYTVIDPADLELRSIPEMYTSAADLSDPGQIAGRVPATPLLAGTRLQADALVPVPAAARGEREVTVTVGVEASIAAALKPGDRVDVVAAYEAKGPAKAYAEVTVSNARVLRVKRLQSTTEQDEDVSVLAGDTTLAATFALAPQEVSRLVLAQTVAKTLRLALVPPAAVGGG